MRETIVLKSLRGPETTHFIDDSYWFHLAHFAVERRSEALIK